MGVNCSVTLSHKADWESVGMVASILLGAKVSKAPFTSHDGWSAEVDGFGYGSKNYRPCVGQPDYIYLLPAYDKENPVAKFIAASDGLPYQMWYGIEDRTLYPNATAAKIALALGICKFFGGRIEYNDYHGKSRTYPTPSYIGAEDGKPWERLQNAFLKLKPLTLKDVDAMRKWAAYEEAA